jgi:hypothetical protein
MSKNIIFILIVLVALGIIGVLYHYNKKHNDIEESFNNQHQNTSNYQTTAPPTNTSQDGISKGGYLSKEEQVNLINDNPNVVQNTLVQLDGTNKCGDPSASEPMGQNEVFKTVSNFDPNSGPVGLNGNQLPNDCYPKDQLTPGELLPQDPNSTWAQVNPSGQGGLEDQNFLNAGYHVGMNTVGQTLRNANYQLRSEPPNPQVKVSPWSQSTIEPDSNRRPMEIGGCE